MTNGTFEAAVGLSGVFDTPGDALRLYKLIRLMPWIELEEYAVDHLAKTLVPTWAEQSPEVAAMYVRLQIKQAANTINAIGILIGQELILANDSIAQRATEEIAILEGIITAGDDASVRIAEILGLPNQNAIEDEDLANDDD